MKLSGSDILVKTLIEQGVDVVFGYPGGQVINIYDSLYKYQDEIQHVLTAHEQATSRVLPMQQMAMLVQQEELA